MIQTLANQSEAILELELGEEFNQTTLLSTMTKACAANLLWNVYVILPTATANENADWLRSHDFVISGFVSRDNITQLKLKRCIRTSGEAGGSLAVAEPMLARSQAETDAINLMIARYGNRTAV